jgi:hypothetical protein
VTGGVVEIPAAVDRLSEIAASQGYKVAVEYAEGRRAGSVTAWVRVIWVPADRWQETPDAVRARMRHAYPESVRDVLRLSHWLAMFGVDFSEL